MISLGGRGGLLFIYGERTHLPELQKEQGLIRDPNELGLTGLASKEVCVGFYFVQ